MIAVGGIIPRRIPSTAITDNDGDVVDDACDCDSTDASAFAPPLEVPRLRIFGNSPNFGWDSQKGTAGDGTTYTIVSGNLSDLHDDAGFASACTLTSGVGNPPASDSRAKARRLPEFFLNDVDIRLVVSAAQHR